MVSITSPNWLVVFGLFSLLVGLFLLGSAIGSDGTRWNSHERLLRGLRGYQRVALSSAMATLAIGLACLMIGQFVVLSLSIPIVLSILIVAFGLLVFALVADSIGARLDYQSMQMSDAMPTAEALSGELREIDRRPVSERFRIAG